MASSDVSTVARRGVAHRKLAPVAVLAEVTAVQKVDPHLPIALLVHALAQILYHISQLHPGLPKLFMKSVVAPEGTASSRLN
jgi:hypothetical protein